MDNELYEFVKKLMELKKQDINKFYEIKGFVEGAFISQEILSKETLKFKVKCINGKKKVTISKKAEF